MQNIENEFWSCRFIEGAASFHYSSIHVCSVPHHQRGQPLITHFDGGKFPVEVLLERRKEIREANQTPQQHVSCAGCALLEKKAWDQKPYVFDYLGFGNWIYCNIECNYCELQTKGLASYAKTFQPYMIHATVQGLIDDGLLARDAIVDWGGGGEPTFYKDFPTVLELLIDYGTFNYIHTNGTRAPSTLRLSAPQNIHIICSVDAGVPETYQLIKAKNYFHRVWKNLHAWKELGSLVTVKYIMKQENCRAADIEGFLAQCKSLRPTSVIVDIDFDYPDAKPEIVDAIVRLKVLLEAENIRVAYGHTGDRFTPEQGVGLRVETAYQVARSPFPELVQIKAAVAPQGMEYRRLGRTGIEVSAVGFGTCQLQVVHEIQAVETLLAGFADGVNLVHTAPDYGRAEEYVAKAVALSGKPVIVASQGFDLAGKKLDHVKHFERLFEQTCRRLGTDRLDLFGIACIEDREAYEENVWGINGMVEFLLRKKQQGRLGGMFCTTHGSPEYIASLLDRDVFDAIMLAYNPLGYHLLSAFAPPDRPYEDIVRNGKEVFQLCHEHDVGVMVMKPLGGGLLTSSDAFPPRRAPSQELTRITAHDMLRSILADSRIASVVPGTASILEAKRNAQSGYRQPPLKPETEQNIAALLTATQQTICSRCGKCEETCSQQLPLASMFRSALVNQHPSAAYELNKNCEYFELYPQQELACDACPDVTCKCPVSIPIPGALRKLHQQMRELEAEGFIPAAVAEQDRIYGGAAFGVKLLNWDLPDRMASGSTTCCNVYVENVGWRGWYPPEGEHPAEVRLLASVNGIAHQTIALPRDIQPFCRHRFVFEITAPTQPGHFAVSLMLVAQQEQFQEQAGVVIFEGSISTEVPLHGARRNAVLALKTKELTVDEIAKRPPYVCAWVDVVLPQTLPAGESHTASITVENRGSRRWHSAHPAGYSVAMAIYWNGKVHSTIWLPHDVDPGAQATFNFQIAIPANAPGGLRFLRFTMLEQHTAWFEQHGSRPYVIAIPATNQDKRTEYDVEWIDHNLPHSWPLGAAFQVYLRLKNRGSRVWRCKHDGGQPTLLFVMQDEKLIHQADLPHDVEPDQDALITFRLTPAESGASGHFNLRLTLMELRVAWFHERGAAALDWPIKLTPPLDGPKAQAMAISMQSNWAFWLPADYVMQSRSGRPYPSVLRSAKGCTITDLEGHQWIDFAMTGGSALLGYANPTVQAAIAAELDSSAIMTLPHVLEIEVTQMLKEMIPSAEMVLFGKHGSDACTAAVRIARLHTGRRKILFSGYHGWHDWFAEYMQPALRSPHTPVEVLRFPMNDIESVARLFAQHPQQVAAVMMEPAAQTEGVHGPIHDANATFLQQVQELCHKHDAVLIFDEVITGFRYRAGSVQAATGVIPDLTCLGKALSGGMALSALVGKQDVMKNTLSRACYYPTFRGEMYSLAAARAALTIYKTDHVPVEIDRIGQRILDGVNRISEELRIAGRMVGLPIRMIYCFDEPDLFRRRLRRTLLQQELLQRGILTFLGYILPSLAHGNAEIERLLEAFRGALELVEKVAAENSFARHLEIPLLD